MSQEKILVVSPVHMFILEVVCLFCNNEYQHILYFYEITQEFVLAGSPTN